MSTEVEKQRHYYTDTAASYDDMHMDGDAEHHLALAWLSSLIEINGYATLLDVGSGTGRVLRYLKNRNDVDVIGVEPVEGLRQQGYLQGLNKFELVDGDALNLGYSDNSFDVVCEFAVLHHIRNHKKAVAEMCRVAKHAVFISDSNNFGQGTPLKRSLKQVLNAIGLWSAYDYVATKGKGYHWSEGDGVYYSYSVFNSLPVVKQKFPNAQFMSTQPSGFNLYRSAPHLAIFASAA